MTDQKASKAKPKRDGKIPSENLFVDITGKRKPDPLSDLQELPKPPAPYQHLLKPLDEEFVTLVSFFETVLRLKDQRKARQLRSDLPEIFNSLWSMDLHKYMLDRMALQGWGSAAVQGFDKIRSSCEETISLFALANIPLAQLKRDFRRLLGEMRGICKTAKLVSRGNTARGKRRAEPPKHYWQSYRLCTELGHTEARAAELLTKQRNKRVRQQQVNREVKRVGEWLVQGGIRQPDTQNHSRPRVETWKPEKIDMRKRQDGRPESKRKKHTEDFDEE